MSIWKQLTSSVDVNVDVVTSHKLCGSKCTMETSRKLRQCVGVNESMETSHTTH